MEINLIFANKTDNDVFLFDEINKMKGTLNMNTDYFIEKFSNKKENNLNPKIFKLGLISKRDLMKFEKFNSDNETLVLICGSKKMANEYIYPAANR